MAIRSSFGESPSNCAPDLVEAVTQSNERAGCTLYPVRTGSTGDLRFGWIVAESLMVTEIS
jgi:hypothetical protein